jgi:hypothetical protein
MKKLFSFCVALIALLVFVGCGGGGGGDSTDSNALFPDINSVFADFNKPHNNIIYMTGYDGLTELQATVFFENLNSSFNCSIDNNIANCQKYNPVTGVLSALGQIEKYDNKYLIGELIFGDSSLTTDKLTDVFPTIYNRKTDYSIDKCYTDDIITEIQTYKESILLQGYIYDDNGFYIKEDNNFVYAWGYTKNSVSWNIVRKDYYYSPDWELIFTCQEFGYN